MRPLLSLPSRTEPLPLPPGSTLHRSRRDPIADISHRHLGARPFRCLIFPVSPR
ncbi:hypothetical protein K438DRAFT_1881792 [Mycena galopus ATCC 62051]|nr:hypothetical protein K438DRAFT_1881792 [Mycena galopus ATCC 62051]